MWQPPLGPQQPPTAPGASQAPPAIQQHQQPLVFGQHQQHATAYHGGGAQQPQPAQTQYVVQPWPGLLQAQQQQQQRPVQFTTQLPQAVMQPSVAHQQVQEGWDLPGQQPPGASWAALQARAAAEAERKSKSQSKRARKRAAREAAAAARRAAKVSGTKRRLGDSARTGGHALEQQLLKRIRGEAPELGESQAVYVSIIDLCLRRARFQRANSSGRSSSIMEGLLTVPQLHVAVNTAAQSKKVPALDINQLKTLLEEYILAQEVPSAEEQRANQLAAAHSSLTAVQTAARVVHASVTMAGVSDSDDEQHRQRVGRPIAVQQQQAPTQCTVAGDTPAVQQDQQQQPNERRHVRFADDGSVTFSPGAAGKRPVAAAVAGKADATELQQQKHTQQQHRQQQQQQGLLRQQKPIKFADGGTPERAEQQGDKLSESHGTQHMRFESDSSTSGDSAADAADDRGEADAASSPQPPSAAAAAAAASAAAATPVTAPPPPPPPQDVSSSMDAAAAVEAILDKTLKLPVVWDGEALDQVVCSYVTNRSICTLMDVRHQLLVLHGLTIAQTRPAGALLMSAAGLPQCPAVKRFFDVSPQLQFIPPVTAHHVVQAATLALLCKWREHGQHYGCSILPNMQRMPGQLVPQQMMNLEQDELVRELFYGNAALANTQGWRACLNVTDLPALAEAAAQQLKAALAAAEAAVLEQLHGKQQQQQRIAARQQLQQLGAARVAGGMTVQQAVEAFRWQQQQQQQQPASLESVCDVLKLTTAGYRTLLEQAARLAEVCLKDSAQAGPCSEWSCMSTFDKLVAGLVEQAAPAAACAEVTLQLLHHVLYYAVNGRIAELYVGRAPPLPAPPAAAAAAARVSGNALEDLTPVCAALGLDTASYQDLVGQIALLAETSLKDAGQVSLWSEWIRMKTFSKSVLDLLYQAVPTAPWPHTALQLLQHVLYYAVNSNLAELYTGPPATPTAAASQQQQVTGSARTAAHDDKAAATDPVSHLAGLLQQLQPAFMALFPAGKQYSPAEIGQLKADLAQSLASAKLQQQQQQQGSEAAVALAKDLPQAEAAAAAAGVGKVMTLVQRLLVPAPAAVPESSSDADDSDADDSSSDDNSSSGSEGSGDEPVGGLETGQKESQAGAAPDEAQLVRQQQAKQYESTVTVAEVAQVVSELADGFSIAALAKLEQQLLDRYQVDSFRELRLGADSLLQLLQQQPEIVSAVTGHDDSNACDVGAKVPLQQVLRTVRQAKASCAGLPEDDLASAVANCLCRTYSVQSVRQLGHGSLDKLLQLSAAVTDGDATGNSSSVSNVYVLAAPELGNSSKGSGLGSVDSSREAAICCLQRAPVLTELNRWSNWQQLFQPSLGDLADFIAAEGPAAGLMALAVPATDTAPAGYGAGPNIEGGPLVKLQSGVNRDHLQEAASQGNPVEFVGACLSLLVKSGGLALAPLSLLAQAVQAGLQSLMTNQTTTTAAETFGPSQPTHASASTAAAFILQCLTLLPEPLATHLSEQLLLQPLYQLLGTASAAQELLLEVASAAAAEAAAGRGPRVTASSSGAAVACSAELAVLHRLGWTLGVTAWQEDWQRRCCDSGKQDAPAARSAGASGDVGTAEAKSLSGCPAGFTAPLQSHSAALEQLLQKLQQPSNRLATLHASFAGNTHTAAAVQGTSTTPAAPVDVSSQQQLVQHIRQHDFGVGVDLSGAAGELVVRQRARIGRALTRLSKELYSCNTHFVLELVQNADDNTYAPDTVPALEFLLLPGAVAALNNEVGFTDKDVRALCDVGASTKLAKRGNSGYIGYKGIGFKSVFKVSDAPELHSAGYHIRFDLQQDPAQGYVLPTWVDTNDCRPAGAAAASSRLQLSLDSTTTIYLPLKRPTLLQQHLQQLHTSSLRQRFQDIKPALLLFLDKLSCICVTDVCQPSNSTVMFKRQLTDHVMELRHGGMAQQAEHWLVVRKTIALPASWHARHQSTLADPYQPSTDGTPTDATTTTQLAVAFALDNPKQPQQQAVYAFLPLRSYGLKFILQADWQVPSSREAVDGDSPWNQALRDEVPSLLLSAMHALMDLASTNAVNAGTSAAADMGGQLVLPPSLPQQQQSGLSVLPRWSRESWLDCWLRCLPLEGQAQGFFAALPLSVATYLRTQQCIPTESGALARPTEVLVCNNSTVRQLISPEQLQQLLGKQFVHAELTSLNSSSELRSLLGVGEFSPLQVVLLIEQLAAAGSLQEQGVQWVQRVLLCLFGMLEAGSAATATATAGSSWPDHAGQLGRAKVLQRLRQLLILPLQDGSFVAVDGSASEAAAPGAATQSVQQPWAGNASSRPVFFPLQGVAAVSPKQRPAASSPVSTRSPISGGISAISSAIGSSLLQLLDGAGVQLEWLTGLQLLSPELFNGLSSEELQMMESGLKALGVCEAQPLDVLQLSLLPDMASSAAMAWSSERLVAYLAFPLLSGLIQPAAGTSALLHAAAHTAATPSRAAVLLRGAPAARPGTAPRAATSMIGRWTAAPTGLQQGLRQQQQQQRDLLDKLRDCAIVQTTQGPVRLRDAAATSSGMATPGRTSGSVYLPPAWTSHCTDWQQHFPQLSWQVVSPVYQQLQPGLDQEWTALFTELGVQSLPPIVPRAIGKHRLQEQLERLQNRQQQLLDRLELLAELHLPVSQTAGSSGAARVPDGQGPGTASDMDISSDGDAVDMDTSAADELLHPVHPGQQLPPWRQRGLFPALTQQEAVAGAVAGPVENVAAATLQPMLEAEGHAAQSAGGPASALDPLLLSDSEGRDSECGAAAAAAAAGDLMQDWVCPDIHALLCALESGAMSEDELPDLDAHRKAMSRLLELLDQHWEAYAPYLWIPPAAAAPADPEMTAGVTASRLAAHQQPGADGQLYRHATPLPLVLQPTSATADVQQAPHNESSADGPDRAAADALLTLTSFGQLLRCALWPCQPKGGCHGDSTTGPQQQLRLLPGHKVLLPTDSITNLFSGLQLPYLDTPARNQQLLDILQVKTVLDTKLVLTVLVGQATGNRFAGQCSIRQLVKAQQDCHPLQQQQPPPTSFTSSCKLMGKLYCYLQQQLRQAKQQAETAVSVDQASSGGHQQPRTAARGHYQQLQHLVVSAFQQHPLVWLPNAAAKPVQQLGNNALQHDIGPGRFYGLTELCLADPSGVLESVACSEQLQRKCSGAGIGLTFDADTAAAANPAADCMPRPVLLHYGSIEQLFLEQLAVPAEADAAESSSDDINPSRPLIAAEPSIEQYTAALQSLAADAANKTQSAGIQASKLAANMNTWMQVLDILSVLAQRLENKQLSALQLAHLQQSLQTHSWLWCYNRQQWVGLQQEPYVSDDAKLSAIIAQVPGVYLIQLQTPTTGPAVQHKLVHLLSLLGVHPLSEGVTSELQYEEMSDWTEMAQRIADALLMAQRWCWHNKSRQDYDAIADRLLPKLDFLTVVAVRDLTISYSIVVEGGDTAVSSPVPAAVVQHDMQLLVAPDQSGLYIEMAGQLARLVLEDSSDVSILEDLLLLVLHELSSDNDAEMLMNTKGIPALPADPRPGQAADSGCTQELDAAQDAAAHTSCINTDAGIKLWQLFVPAVPNVFAGNELEDIRLDAAAEADLDVDDDDNAEPLGVWEAEASDDESDLDYDDDEEELQELTTNVTADITATVADVTADVPTGVTTGKLTHSAVQGLPADELAEAPPTAAAPTAVAPTDQPGTVSHTTVASPAAAAASPQAAAVAGGRFWLPEPHITPVEHIAYANKSKPAVVVAVYKAVQIEVARYLSYAAAAAVVVGGSANGEPTAVSEDGSEAPGTVDTSKASTAGTDVASAVKDPAAAAASAAVGGVKQSALDHLSKDAVTAFEKLLGSWTVNAEDSHRVLSAAGGTAAALARAAGMQYGCREHVAFVSRLLAGIFPGRLGTNRQWKSRTRQLAGGDLLAKDCHGGKAIRLVDVTPMQPLVLWETAVDVQAEQRKATGRWGEQMVALFLKLKLSRFAEVVWVNDKQETLLPYDIKVTYQDGHVEYVEVKTTAKPELQQFYISYKELQTAAKFGNSFTVVRVYGCPTYSRRPLQVPDQHKHIALLPGELRQQTSPVDKKSKGKAHAGVAIGRHEHTRLLFLQDPVQLLRKQLVRLLMEV